jgi:isoleucyl-tRNA synthetase
LENNWKGFLKVKAIDFENFKEGDVPYQIIAEAKGADLVGIKYEQLMPLFSISKCENAFRVISGDFRLLKMEYVAYFTDFADAKC